MTDHRPRLFWFRRDLRLIDNPGLAAAADGGPVIPVFILDPETEALGAAAKWRLGLSLADLAARLRAAGSGLVLRRGGALETLRALVRETGAGAVHWSRLYSPEAVARDTDVKETLRREGVVAISHEGNLLWEPWKIETGSGTPFKVFTPFWNAVGRRDPARPVAAPALAAPAGWPVSDRLEDWALGAAMDRGAAVVGHHVHVGKTRPGRLETLLEHGLARYWEDRERPDREGGSGLSENLTYGEISVRRIWHAVRDRGGAGSEAFLREIGWREFAWHLMWHNPGLASTNWRAEWDDFPWRGDGAEAEAWRRGMTGEPMVDAGMRQMFVTGTMHNRVRMLVASYLTKHLLTHWKVGLDWFAECLTDWDPAANAMNWQWVAGSGPDAAPYFRVFNPALQAAKFDPKGAYRQRFVLGFDGAAEAEARAFFDAVPRSWKLDARAAYPSPVVDLAAGRAAALAAYEHHRGK